MVSKSDESILNTPGKVERFDELSDGLKRILCSKSFGKKIRRAEISSCPNSKKTMYRGNQTRNFEGFHGITTCSIK